MLELFAKKENHQCLNLS